MTLLSKHMTLGSCPHSHGAMWGKERSLFYSYSYPKIRHSRRGSHEATLFRQRPIIFHILDVSLLRRRHYLVTSKPLVFTIGRMSLGEHELRYCRQCRKNMPVEDFINRTKNGYCIVCKTCRDRQLRRYYGKTRVLSMMCREERWTWAISLRGEGGWKQKGSSATEEGVFACGLPFLSKHHKWERHVTSKSFAKGKSNRYSPVSSSAICCGQQYIEHTG